jgi:hypothetical protein
MMAAAWGSSLTGSEQTAIDIAVQVSGQQAVQDLQARLAGVRQEIDFQKAAYAGGAQTLQEFQKEIKALIVDQAKLEEAFNRAANAMAGWNKGVNVSQQAGLQLAYALDDIQYGFNGIVNNIPGIVQSLGGNAGLAGGLGAAAVALNIFNSVLKASGVDLGGIFKEGLKEAARGLDLMRDPAKDAADSLAGMQEQIKAIEDNPLKFKEDFDSLRALTAEVHTAERALRELEALRNRRSADQQEAFESVQKGVQEGGGADNFVNAYIEIAKRNGTYGAGSDLVGKIQEQEEIVQGQALGRRDPGPLGILARYRSDAAAAEKARLEEELLNKEKLKAASLLNLTNGEGSRRTLDDLVNDPRNQGILQANQIDVDRLGGGIGAASPENIGRRARNKVAKQEQARADREQKEADREDAKLEREVDQAVDQAEDLSQKIGWQQRRAAEKGQREGKAAANKAQNDALRAEREAPGLQQKRDVRDLGREARGRAMGMGLGEMNAAQAQAAGQKALGLIKGGLDPNAALQKTIFDMAQAVEQAHANIQAQQMGFVNVSQRMRALHQNARRGRQRGPTIGMTH